MVMTEAAIDGGLTRDLYAALGRKLDNGAWAVRLLPKPFVRWIWAGGLLMALGGCCAGGPALPPFRKTVPEADETQRTVITAADFSADCRGAAVAAPGARRG